MPSGGATPLTGEAWEYVRRTFNAAKENGLEYEWLQWFAGGLAIDKMSPESAAIAAAVEWDF